VAASSNTVSKGATWEWKRRPSSVSDTARGVRSRRRTPTRASSLATARLTPEGVRAERHSRPNEIAGLHPIAAALVQFETFWEQQERSRY
jgi:hypothetical protein